MLKILNFAAQNTVSRGKWTTAWEAGSTWMERIVLARCANLLNRINFEFWKTSKSAVLTTYFYTAGWKRRSRPTGPRWTSRTEGKWTVEWSEGYLSQEIDLRALNSCSSKVKKILEKIPLVWAVLPTSDNSWTHAHVTGTNIRVGGCVSALTKVPLRADLFCLNL